VPAASLACSRRDRPRRARRRHDRAVVPVCPQLAGAPLRYRTPGDHRLGSDPAACHGQDPATLAADDITLSDAKGHVGLLTVPLSGHQVMINGHALVHRSSSFVAAIPPARNRVPGGASAGTQSGGRPVRSFQEGPHPLPIASLGLRDLLNT
jgi:hypothetical protein